MISIEKTFQIGTPLLGTCFVGQQIPNEFLIKNRFPDWDKFQIRCDNNQTEIKPFRRSSSQRSGDLITNYDDDPMDDMGRCSIGGR